MAVRDWLRGRIGTMHRILILVDRQLSYWNAFMLSSSLETVN